MFSAQVWVNEEDQLRIISMQQGVDVKGVIDRLSRGIKTVGDPRPARGTRGQSGGQTGITYDISNNQRLGYTKVRRD